MKKLLSFILMVVFAVSQLGCTSFTKDLWGGTDPNHKAWIDVEEITEEELKARGVPYRRYSTEKMDGFIVEKSDREKLKDYTYRALGTPVTLAADAAVAAGAAIVVVGMMYIEGTGSGSGTL